ncbi:MAG TPA: hypothetical protein VFW94_19295 [Candidatus Acidoferrales bacterium]|nr:hypothetical protein [Candidatus Acidoferrales bacterium]
MIIHVVRCCDYRHAPIAKGQRWVRQKIYKPALDNEDPSYRHYHAESFDEQTESCWERQLERDLAQTAA